MVYLYCSKFSSWQDRASFQYDTVWRLTLTCGRSIFTYMIYTVIDWKFHICKTIYLNHFHPLPSRRESMWAFLSCILLCINHVIYRLRLHVVQTLINWYFSFSIFSLRSGLLHLQLDAILLIRLQCGTLRRRRIPIRLPLRVLELQQLPRKICLWRPIRNPRRILWSILCWILPVLRRRILFDQVSRWNYVPLTAHLPTYRMLKVLYFFPHRYSESAQLFWI